MRPPQQIVNGSLVLRQILYNFVGGVAFMLPASIVEAGGFFFFVHSLKLLLRGYTLRLVPLFLYLWKPGYVLTTFPTRDGQNIYSSR